MRIKEVQYALEPAIFKIRNTCDPEIKQRLQEIPHLCSFYSELDLDRTRPRVYVAKPKQEVCYWEE